MRFTIALFLLGVLPAAAQRPYSRDLREPSENLAPFVGTPQPVVDRMLELAAIKPGEIVYDLGCGDGRILIAAAQKYHAKGIGIELSNRLVETATNMVQHAGLVDLITIRQGHLLNVNFSDADVVMIYLETASNEMLRPNLEKYLKHGARVVSHDFEIRGWKPVKIDRMQAFNRNHLIYLYEVPTSFKHRKTEQEK